MRLVIHLFLVIGLSFPCFTQAQTSLENISSKDLDSIAQKLFSERQFNSSLFYTENLLKKLETEVGKKDTAYIEAQILLSAIHYFFEDYELAKEIIKTAIVTQEKERGTENRLYANLLEMKLLTHVQLLEPMHVSKIRKDLKVLHPKISEGAMLDYTQFVRSFASYHGQIAQGEQRERLLLLLKKHWEEEEGMEGQNYLDILATLSSSYSFDNKEEAGMQLLLQVIETRERIGDTESEAYIDNVNDLAILYGYLDKNDEAEKLFQKALNLCVKILGKEVETYAWICQKRGDFYTGLNRLDEAIASYKTANQIFEKRNGRVSEGFSWSLNNLSRAYSLKGQVDKAEQTLLEVLALKEQIYGKKHTEYSYTLGTLTNMYRKKGDLERALAYNLKDFVCLGSSWDTLTELSDKFIKEIPNATYLNVNYAFGRIFNLLNIVETYYAKTEDVKWLEKAFLICQSGLLFSEKAKNALTNENDQLGILGNHNVFSAWGVEQAFRLSEASTSQAETYLKAAFSFTEQSKAVVLAGALKEQKAQRLSDIPPALASKEKRLKEELGALKKKLLESKDESEGTNVRVEFAEKNNEIDQFKAALEKDYPQYFELKYKAHTLQVEDVQRMLAPKTACLAFQIGNFGNFIFVITPTDYFVVGIDSSVEVINRYTAQLRKNLSDYSYIRSDMHKSFKEFTVSAHWFYNMLIKPALDSCPGIDKLMIVPDGSLGHIPFEVFLKELPLGQEAEYDSLAYLIRDYQVSYSYSVSLWAENSKMPQRAGNHRMLAMAATYDKSMHNLIMDLRGDYLANLRKGLQPLPAAQEEVEALVGHVEGDFLYGNDVNEAFFRKNAQDYSIIHLAMHGLLNQETPILSGLVFTENQDKNQDNFLQAYEIAHLHLDAELVVLSACETGYGKFQQGEGVMSLARSFMYAGVPSLVVSMWQVNDHSTSVIMQSFYENLAKGMNKAAALRASKLDYLSRAKGIALHPAFWSPFIQLGDSRPIDMSKQAIGLWYGIGGMVLLLLGGFFVFRRKNVE